MNQQYKNIIVCLKTLIDTHDFVLIPNFGALVMKLESAEFSLSQNVIYPPRKKILFNPALKHNDGLFVAEVQKQLNIDYSSAQALVEQFVQNILVLLSSKRRVNFEGVGYFYKDLEENIFFEQQSDTFLSSESFGLYPIHITYAENEKSLSDIITNNQDATAERVIKLNTKNIYKGVAVLLIAVLFLSYWFIAPISRNKIFSSIFNITGNVTKRYYRVILPLPDVNIKYNELSVKETNLKNNTTIFHTELVTKFSIVLGCFKNQNNAERFHQNLSKQDIKTSITYNTEKSLFVVSIQGFANKETASEKLVGIKSTGIAQDAWIKEEK